MFKINFTKFFIALNGAPHHTDVSESGSQIRELLTLTLVGGKRPWGPLEGRHEGPHRGKVKRKSYVPAVVQKVQRFGSVAAETITGLGCDDTRFWGLFKKRKHLIKYNVLKNSAILSYIVIMSRNVSA